MPRSVTVNKANTVLPDGEIYQVGETVILTDLEWGQVNPALIPTSLIDNGYVAGDGGVGPQGPPGPQGPAGDGGSYVHVQEEPSNIWTITHPLGYRPAVFVEDTGGNNMEGDVSYPSIGSITISFSASFAGRAYLS